MFRLLRYFSVTSLIVFAIVTVLLAFFYRQTAVSDLVELEESKNVALAQSFANSLWPQFAAFANSPATAEMNGDELRATPEVRAFHQTVLEQMDGLSLVKVKIYTTEGLTVYSSQLDQIGASKIENPGFLSALAGESASIITHRDSFNAFEGVVEDRNLFEIYLPIRAAGATGSIDAVIELYDDVTPLLQTIASTQITLTVGLAIALLALYWILFFIVRSADRILQRQYVDLRSANDELEKKSRELERSNDELQQFAYTASHDLQEPLRKIQAFGERLTKRNDDSLDDQSKLYLERMQAAADRMRMLIQDLLAFSRVNTKDKTFSTVDLSQVANEVLSDLEVGIAQSGGRVTIDSLPTIEADPVQMRQLLQNLIGNALKFHRPDVPPVIKVTSERHGDRHEIVVEDNGIGFDSKHSDRIFTLFQRLHGRGEYEGTGMGLSIVRKIVERHGGTITAQGEAGKGATFTISFPASPMTQQLEFGKAA